MAEIMRRKKKLNIEKHRKAEEEMAKYKAYGVK
jgi:hypothetical protein